MSGLFLKFKSDPVGFLRRALYKTLIAPLKYRSKGGYDAARYWQDRFVKHGTSLKGVGDEGLSEHDNQAMYENAAKTFLNICQQEGIDFTTSRVLEIGCGNGFYTRLLQEQGVSRYLGVDITDALFPDLIKRFAVFQFIRRDITADLIEGEFDLILMIDVIEHIVGEEKLDFAMANVQRCLAENGRFLVAPIVDHGKSSLFYVRFWSAEDVRSRLSRCVCSNLTPFRYSHLLVAKKTGLTLNSGKH
ncbi:methyltransferase family protein [Sulfurirhabdus autotrophica]|uniref:Methyltransferase family protein n=2 Tax=Sulfurirhabdus autotrophica TaxID=1706046 RepID=A0A4R3XQ96_9PROT|nr:methyltransferase family protein [Sulfurirhabdus autotrophica]